MTDWTAERGVATETEIDRFIALVGGERVDRRFPQPAFQNADYLFPTQKVVIELKIIETEFGDTEAFALKEVALLHDMAARFGLGPILRGEPEPAAFYARRKRELYRAPLVRIAKKANRQLRETREALGDGYSGLLWLVNDNFRKIGSDLAISLICSTLIGQHSSVDGLIYVTNHYVDLPGSDLANLLWVPAYSQAAPEFLPDFVNWLGSAWGDFCEDRLGDFDGRLKGPDIVLTGAAPIMGGGKG